MPYDYTFCRILARIIFGLAAFDNFVRRGYMRNVSQEMSTAEMLRLALLRETVALAEMIESELQIAECEKASDALTRSRQGMETSSVIVNNQ